MWKTKHINVEELKKSKLTPYRCLLKLDLDCSGKAKGKAVKACSQEMNIIVLYME